MLEAWGNDPNITIQIETIFKESGVGEPTNLGANYNQSHEKHKSLISKFIFMQSYIVDTEKGNKILRSQLNIHRTEGFN